MNINIIEKQKLRTFLIRLRQNARTVTLVQNKNKTEQNEQSSKQMICCICIEKRIHEIRISKISLVET